MTKTTGRSMMGIALLLGACTATVAEPEEPVDVTVAPQSSPEATSPPAAEVATPRRTTTPAPTAEVATELGPPPGVLPPGLLPQPASPPPGAPVTTATPLGGGLPTLSAVLAAVAGSNATGMQALGQPVAASFAQGEVLVVPVNVNPGKCITVIGAAGPGISELDLQLTVAFPIPNMPPVVLAQDNDTGPTATIGGGKNCFKGAMPIPMPAVVIAKATHGAGIGAVQIFEK